MKEQIENIIEKLRNAKWYLVQNDRRGVVLLDEVCSPGFNDLTDLLEEVVDLQEEHRSLIEEFTELENEFGDTDNENFELKREIDTLRQKLHDARL